MISQLFRNSRINFAVNHAVGGALPYAILSTAFFSSVSSKNAKQFASSRNQQRRGGSASLGKRENRTPRAYTENNNNSKQTPNRNRGASLDGLSWSSFSSNPKAINTTTSTTQSRISNSSNGDEFWKIEPTRGTATTTNNTTTGRNSAFLDRIFSPPAVQPRTTTTTTTSTDSTDASSSSNDNSTTHLSRLASILPKSAKYIAFFKPYGVVSDHNPHQPDGCKCLADFPFPRGVRAAGQLDKDSEGLMLSSDKPEVLDFLTNPDYRLIKTYLVLVEGVPSEEQLDKLRNGIDLPGKESKKRSYAFRTRPCEVKRIDDIAAYLGGGRELPPREPPVNPMYKHTTWLEIKLTEGKYRQVRRMAAAIGHPALRLIRVGIGKLFLFKGPLASAAPGQLIEVHRSDIF